MSKRKKYTITNRPTALNHGDIVVFELKGDTLRYDVCQGYLHCGCGGNARVFDLLGMSRRQRENFAEKAYGYMSRACGVWPWFDERDYPAATRLVNALFDKIAKLGTKAKAPKPLHRWAIIGSGKTRGHVEAATQKEAIAKFEREKRGGSPLPSGWTVVDRGPVEAEAVVPEAKQANPARFKVGDQIKGKTIAGFHFEKVTIDEVDESSVPYNTRVGWCRHGDVELVDEPAIEPGHFKATMDSGDTIEFWLANTSGGVTLYGRDDRFTKAILFLGQGRGGELYRYTGAGLRGLKTTKDGRIVL